MIRHRLYRVLLHSFQERRKRICQEEEQAEDTEAVRAVARVDREEAREAAPPAAREDPEAEGTGAVREHLHPRAEAGVDMEDIPAEDAAAFRFAAS